MLKRIDHIVLATRDLPRLLAFYRKLPGISEIMEAGRAVLKFGEQKINIHPYPSPFAMVAANPGKGCQIFSLKFTGSGARLQNELAQAGIPISKEACCCENISIAVFNCFSIRDPDGNLIRVQASEDGAPAKAESIAAISLLASNLQAALRFYMELPGISARKDSDGYELRFEGGAIRLVARSDCLAPGSGDFCLLMDGDLEALYDSLRAKGARFASGDGIAAREGAQGPLRSFYLRDPDSNLVEISVQA